MDRRQKVKSNVSTLRKSTAAKRKKIRLQQLRATKAALKRQHGRIFSLEMKRLSTTDGFWTSQDVRSSRSSSASTSVDQSDSSAKGKRSQSLPSSSSSTPSSSTSKNLKAGSSTKLKAKGPGIPTTKKVGKGPSSKFKKKTASSREMQRLGTTPGFSYPKSVESAAMSSIDSRRNVEKDRYKEDLLKAFSSGTSKLKHLSNIGGVSSPGITDLSPRRGSRDASPLSTSSSVDRMHRRSSRKRLENNEDDQRSINSDKASIDGTSHKRSRSAVSNSDSDKTTQKTKSEEEGKKRTLTPQQRNSEPAVKRRKVGDEKTGNKLSSKGLGKATPKATPSPKVLGRVNRLTQASKADNSTSKPTVSNSTPKMPSSSADDDRITISDFLGSNELKRLNTTDGFWSPLPQITYVLGGKRLRRKIATQSGQSQNQLLEHRKKKLRSIKRSALNRPQPLPDATSKKSSLNKKLSLPRSSDLCSQGQIKSKSPKTFMFGSKKRRGRRKRNQLSHPSPLTAGKESNEDTGTKSELRKTAHISESKHTSSDEKGDLTLKRPVMMEKTWIRGRKKKGERRIAPIKTFNTRGRINLLDKSLEVLKQCEESCSKSPTKAKTSGQQGSSVERECTDSKNKGLRTKSGKPNIKSPEGSHTSDDHSNIFDLMKQETTDVGVRLTRSNIKNEEEDSKSSVSNGKSLSRRETRSGAVLIKSRSRGRPKKKVNMTYGAQSLLSVLRNARDRSPLLTEKGFESRKTLRERIRKNTRSNSGSKKNSDTQLLRDKVGSKISANIDAKPKTNTEKKVLSPTSIKVEKPILTKIEKATSHCIGSGDVDKIDKTELVDKSSTKSATDKLSGGAKSESSSGNEKDRSVKAINKEMEDSTSSDTSKVSRSDKVKCLNDVAMETDSVIGIPSGDISDEKQSLVDVPHSPVTQDIFTTDSSHDPYSEKSCTDEGTAKIEKDIHDNENIKNSDEGMTKHLSTEDWDTSQNIVRSTSPEESSVDVRMVESEGGSEQNIPEENGSRDASGKQDSLTESCNVVDDMKSENISSSLLPLEMSNENSNEIKITEDKSADEKDIESYNSQSGNASGKLSPFPECEGKTSETTLDDENNRDAVVPGEVVIQGIDQSDQSSLSSSNVSQPVQAETQEGADNVIPSQVEEDQNDTSLCGPFVPEKDTPASLNAGTVEDIKDTSASLNSGTVEDKEDTPASLNAGTVEDTKDTPASLDAGTVEDKEDTSVSLNAGAVEDTKDTPASLNAGTVEDTKDTPASLIAGTLEDTKDTPASLNAGAVEDTKDTPASLNTGAVEDTKETSASLNARTVEDTKDTPASLIAGTVEDTNDTPASLNTGTVEDTNDTPASLNTGTVEGTKDTPASLNAGTIEDKETSRSVDESGEACAKITENITNQEMDKMLTTVDDLGDNAKETPQNPVIETEDCMALNDISSSEKEKSVTAEDGDIKYSGDHDAATMEEKRNDIAEEIQEHTDAIEKTSGSIVDNFEKDVGETKTCVGEETDKVVSSAVSSVEAESSSPSEKLETGVTATVSEIEISERITKETEKIVLNLQSSTDLKVEKAHATRSQVSEESGLDVPQSPSKISLSRRKLAQGLLQKSPLRRVRKRRTSLWSRGVVQKRVKPLSTDRHPKSKTSLPLQPGSLKNTMKDSSGNKVPGNDNFTVLAMQASKIANVSPNSDKPKKLRNILKRLKTDANLANASIDDKNLQTRARKGLLPISTSGPGKRLKLNPSSTSKVSKMAESTSVAVESVRKHLCSKKDPVNKEDVLPTLSRLDLDLSKLETLPHDDVPPVLTPQKPIESILLLDPDRVVGAEEGVVDESVDDTDFHLYLSGASDEEDSSGQNVSQGNILAGTSKTNQGKSIRVLTFPSLVEAESIYSQNAASSECPELKPVDLVPNKAKPTPKIRGKRGRPPGIPTNQSRRNVLTQPSRTARKSLSSPTSSSLSTSPNPLRTFEFRKKTTRSPLEMLEMKRKQEEAMYDQEMERLHARKINRREKRIARVSAEDCSGEILAHYFGLKPCSVVLSDFVKKLNLDRTVAEFYDDPPSSPYSIQYEDDLGDEDWCADLEDVQLEDDDSEMVKKDETSKRPLIPRLKLKRVPRKDKQLQLKAKNLISEMKSPLEEPLKLVIKTENSSDIESSPRAKGHRASLPQTPSQVSFVGNYIEFLKNRSESGASSEIAEDRAQIPDKAYGEKAGKETDFSDSIKETKSSMVCISSAEKAVRPQVITNSDKIPLPNETVGLDVEESTTTTTTTITLEKGNFIMGNEIENTPANPEHATQILSEPTDQGTEEEDVLILDLNDTTQGDVLPVDKYSFIMSMSSSQDGSDETVIQPPISEADTVNTSQQVLVVNEPGKTLVSQPEVDSVGTLLNSELDTNNSNDDPSQNQVKSQLVSEKDTDDVMNISDGSAEVLAKSVTACVHSSPSSTTKTDTSVFQSTAAIVNSETHSQGAKQVLSRETDSKNNESTNTSLTSLSNRETSSSRLDDGISEKESDDPTSLNNNNNNLAKSCLTPKLTISSSPVHSTSSEDPNDENRKLKTIPASYKQMSGPYKCKRCNFTAVSKLSIESHIYSHIPGVHFQCVVCQSEFSSMAAISSHFKNSHVNMEAEFYISRHVDESNFYMIEKEPEPVASPVNPAAGGQSPPFIISLVVSGSGVSGTRPVRASTASRRFVCTHCGFSTNVKEDIEQHVFDLHSTQTLFTCTLCKDSVGISEAKIKQHSLQTHPSRQRPYVKLPDFYDADQLAMVEKDGGADGGANVVRVSTFFPGEESPQEESTVGHQMKAKDYLYLQEGWKGKTSAEADSTTVTEYSDENLVAESSQEQTSEDICSAVDESVEANSSTTDGTLSLEPEPNATEMEEDGVPQLKIANVVSLADNDEDADDSSIGGVDPVSGATTIRIESVCSIPHESSLGAPSPQTVSISQGQSSSSPLSSAATTVAASIDTATLPQVSLVSSKETSHLPACTTKDGSAPSEVENNTSLLDTASDLSVHSMTPTTSSSGLPTTSSVFQSDAVVVSLQSSAVDKTTSLLLPDVDMEATSHTSDMPSTSTESSSSDHGNKSTYSVASNSSLADTNVTQSGSRSSHQILSSSSSPSPSSSLSSSPMSGLPLSYQCKSCKVHTPYLLMMVRHLKSCHPKILCFSCPYCKSGQSFNTQKQLRNHIRAAHPDKVTKNEMSLSEEAKKFVEAMVLPKSPQCIQVGNRLILEEDIHTCTICSLRMTSLSCVYDHLNEKHSDLFEFVCPSCQSFKNKSLQVVSNHCMSSHGTELDKDKVHVSVPKYLFTNLTCISKNGKYIEKNLLATSSSTASSKDGSAASVDEGANSSSKEAKKTVDPQPITASQDLSNVDSQEVNASHRISSEGRSAPPPAHLTPPATISLTSDAFFKQAPLIGIPITPINTSTGIVTARPMIAISSSLFDTSSLSRSASSSQVPGKASSGAPHKGASVSEQRAPKAHSLPVLNVPTIRPRSVPTPHQPQSKRSTSSSDTTSIASSSLSSKVPGSSVDQLPDDEPSPDAFKIFNLRPRGLTPSVMPPPVSLPQGTPSVFPPISTSTSLPSGFIPGPMAGFPAAMVIPPALIHGAFPFATANMVNPLTDGTASAASEAAKAQGQFPLQKLRQILPAMHPSQLLARLPTAPNLTQVTPIYPPHHLSSQPGRPANPSLRSSTPSGSHTSSYPTPHAHGVRPQRPSHMTLQQGMSIRQPACSMSSVRGHFQASPSTLHPPQQDASPSGSHMTSASFLKKGRKSSAMYRCPYCADSVSLRALEVAFHIRAAHPGRPVSFQKAA